MNLTIYGNYPTKCPVCDAQLRTEDDQPVEGELFECDECGVELEIVEANLEEGIIICSEAPEEAEDWGE